MKGMPLFVLRFLNDMVDLVDLVVQHVRLQRDHDGFGDPLSIFILFIPTVLILIAAILLVLLAPVLPLVLLLAIVHRVAE
jgi:hypothetical protein